MDFVHTHAPDGEDKVKINYLPENRTLIDKKEIKIFLKGKVMRKKKDFLIVSAVLFVVSFIIYCVIVAPQHENVEALKTMTLAYPYNLLVLASAISYFITSIYYLIKLSVPFFEKRQLWFRVLLAALFPISVPLMIAVSLVITLPYGFYCIIKVCFSKDKK